MKDELMNEVNYYNEQYLNKLASVYWKKEDVLRVVHALE